MKQVDWKSGRIYINRNLNHNIIQLIYLTFIGQPSNISRVHIFYKYTWNIHRVCWAMKQILTNLKSIKLCEVYCLARIKLKSLIHNSKHWKLNNKLSSNVWVKKSKEKLEKNLIEQKKKVQRVTVYRILVRQCLGGKFIALGIHIGKEEGSWSNNLSNKLPI